MAHTGERTDPSDNAYRLDDQVGYLLRLASQRHAMIFQAHATDNLTPTQFSALMRISEHGECSQNRLGRLAAMDVATIKGVVDRLGQKGLTQSAADPNDKRRSLISLTARGKDMIARLHEMGRAITDETLQPLSKAEQRTLLKLLQKIS